METRTKTSPSSEPIAAATLYKWVDYQGDDATEQTLIQNMGVSARELVEQESGICLASQTKVTTVKAEYDIYDNKFTLPFKPVMSITHVKGIDIEGTQTALTLNTGYYKFGKDEIEIEININPSTVPVGVTSDYVGYEVEYVVGHGTSDPNRLPKFLLVSCLKLVAEWWQNKHDWIPVMTSSARRIIRDGCGDIFLT